MRFRSGLMFLGTGLLTGGVAMASTMAGCQSETTSSAASSTTGSGGSSTTSGTGGNSTGTGGSSTGTGGDTTGTGGAPPETVTIKDITTSKVGPGLQVKVTGVAMSQKFLVSKGSKSGSCLWGVFVSAPGLTTTEANSGLLVVNYGDNATIPDGGTKAFCPRLGIDPIGDKIPDDTRPGDVLDLIGETSYFLLPDCAAMAGGSTVAEFQLSKGSSVTKTGTATPPKPYVLTKAEIDQANDQNDQAFHDKWGGVKVAVANVVSEPQDDGMGGMAITDNFGHILAHDKTIAAPTAANKLQVGDKIYYRGFLANNNACYAGPVYANPVTEFTHMEGFLYLDFCTWNLQPNDKCADLDPKSEDCTSAAMCAQP